MNFQTHQDLGLMWQIHHPIRLSVWVSAMKKMAVGKTLQGQSVDSHRYSPCRFGNATLTYCSDISHRCSRLFLSPFRWYHHSWDHDLHLIYRHSVFPARIENLRIYARTHYLGISNQNHPTISKFNKGCQALPIVLPQDALHLLMHNL